MSSSIIQTDDKNLLEILWNYKTTVKMTIKIAT